MNVNIRNGTTAVILVFQTILNTLVFAITEDTCSRYRSSTVRNVVVQELSLFYEQFKGSMPITCPLHKERDIYGLQEEHKQKESVSRWSCDFCGKSFYEEHWLNVHFNNRHSDKLRKGKHVTCLEHYCDVFRCEVLTGAKKVTYWDRALCKDSDLHILFGKCNELINECTPADIEMDTQRQFQDKVKKSICGYLNCKMYWELPESEVNAVSTALYAIAAMFLGVLLMIYYYVAYSHFYTDESLVTQWQEMDKQYHNGPRYPNPPGRQSISMRQRRGAYR